MRTPFVILAGSMLLAGCGPGPNVVYLPAPAPEPVVVSAPPPVGITIVRADDDGALVSTNQASYVAVFELVPYRGVRLVYPVTRAQELSSLTGSNLLHLSTRRFVHSEVRYDRDRRDDGDRDAVPARYLYAVASDRPLRLTSNAFDDDYLRGVLDERTYRAEDPYRTMEALSRRFVPKGAEESWGEDMYTLDAARRGNAARIATLYCPDGSVLYVRDDVADRVVCPVNPRAHATAAPVRPARPDSVVASTGRRVARRSDPRLQPPPFRIPHRTEGEEGVLQQGGGRPATGVRPPVRPDAPARSDSARDDGRGKGQDAKGQDGKEKDAKGQDGKEKDAKGQDGKTHDDNGNHYGWGNVRKRDAGNGGKDDRAGRGTERDSVTATKGHGDDKREPGAATGPVRPTVPVPPPQQHPDAETPRGMHSEPTLVRELPVLPPAQHGAKPDSAVAPVRPYQRLKRVKPDSVADSPAPAGSATPESMSPRPR